MSTLLFNATGQSLFFESNGELVEIPRAPQPRMLYANDEIEITFEHAESGTLFNLPVTSSPVRSTTFAPVIAPGVMYVVEPGVALSLPDRIDLVCVAAVAEHDSLIVIKRLVRPLPSRGYVPNLGNPLGL
jgi:hypothetical protein